MRLEYFQLIDRIIDLDLEGRKIRAEATVPTTSTIFEGHFPGHPLMPGVLLMESMAQTSGWLIIGLTKFTRMPFLAAFKEAKLRTFVTPEKLSRCPPSSCMTAPASPSPPPKSRSTASGSATPRSPSGWSEFPSPEFRATMETWAANIGFPIEAPSHG